MDLHDLMFVDPPRLSDQAASELLEFLYEIINAFENHYADQLRRYHHEQQRDRSQPDLFEDFDDELPSF